jgi:sulfate transport system ATP-binding protein
VSIVLDHLGKRYAGQPVVHEVSLEVATGELFVLLGPSGSGKSTLLRMIAGLAEADSGRILLQGRDVTALPPQRRGVGLVFQSYALFRHMTVAENVEFPLAVRKVVAGERRRRRDELLELVGLAGLGRRLPRQLSGGQQQRVALARALAHQPEVLLLDEPFGALDTKIRTELRAALQAIQRELRITTLFVTHDQEEAFELADRVGVMNFGRLLEAGPPRELYLRPETEFVATFLGTANLLVGTSTPGGLRVGPVEFPLPTLTAAGGESRRVQVLFRPEDVALAGSPERLAEPLIGRGTVESASFVGSYEKLRLRLPALPGVRTIAPPVPFGADYLLVEAVRSQHWARRLPLKPGDGAWVGVRRVHALAHPGLSFLLLTDGSPAAEAALGLGGEIARLAHARVTLLAHGFNGAGEEYLRRARERLGSGVAALEWRQVAGDPADALVHESLRRAPDLVVAGVEDDGRPLAEAALAAGGHHLLLVPSPQRAAARGAEAIPARLLICVAVGEPGKQDVGFAGRLARHLGAEATILTVLSAADAAGPARSQAERFLTASARTLGRLGVPAKTATRQGSPREGIRAELEDGGHDLLVIGAPLPQAAGRVRLTGLVGQLLAEADRPVLIVRSPEGAA